MKGSKKICEKHGEYYTEIVELFGMHTEFDKCPVCAAEQELQEVKRQEEEDARRFIESYDKRGIEPEFYNATLDNYKPETPSEKEAKQAVQDLIDGKIHKLVLLGQNGTGKTHLGIAAVKALKGIRITMFELSARIRAGFNEGYSELKVLNELLEYRIIVIDELGRTKGSEAERNWMSYMTDKCHTRGIRLMYISNRSTARNLPQDRSSEAFENYFDNDVISRLRQDSKIVEVKGRDRRGAHQEVQRS